MTAGTFETVKETATFASWLGLISLNVSFPDSSCSSHTRLFHKKTTTSALSVSGECSMDDEVWRVADLVVFASSSCTVTFCILRSCNWRHLQDASCYPSDLLLSTPLQSRPFASCLDQRLHAQSSASDLVDFEVYFCKTLSDGLIWSFTNFGFRDTYLGLSTCVQPADLQSHRAKRVSPVSPRPLTIRTTTDDHFFLLYLVQERKHLPLCGLV